MSAGHATAAQNKARYAALERSPRCPCGAALEITTSGNGLTYEGCPRCHTWGPVPTRPGDGGIRCDVDRQPRTEEERARRRGDWKLTSRERRACARASGQRSYAAYHRQFRRDGVEILRPLERRP